jgi:hypothetical protein
MGNDGPTDVHDAQRRLCFIIAKSQGVMGSGGEPFDVADANKEAEDIDFHSAFDVPEDAVVNYDPQDNEGALVYPA